MAAGRQSPPGVEPIAKTMHSVSNASGRKTDLAVFGASPLEGKLATSSSHHHTRPHYTRPHGSYQVSCEQLPRFADGRPRQSSGPNGRTPDASRAGHTDAWQQHGHFLPAVAGDQRPVAGPDFRDALPQNPGRRAQDLVTRLMAVSRKRLARPRRVRNDGRCHKIDATRRIRILCPFVPTPNLTGIRDRIVAQQWMTVA